MSGAGEFVVIKRSDQRREVMEAALVLTAMEIENYIEQRNAQWLLYVEPDKHHAAQTQLILYAEENKPPVEQAVPFTIVDDGWLGVLAYLTVIWCVPALQSYTDANLPELGRLHVGAVWQGELWRPVTALTLHSDIAHILSNSFFGVVFGLFVGRHLGSGLGWLLVLLCGAAANGLNALIQPDHFKAIGASTATFACLGLVPAFAWRRGYFRGKGWARGFAPMFGAIALLAFTGGFGNQQVDIFGHLFGFLAGIGMGLLVAHIDLARISKADQQRAGFFAAFLVAVAWMFGAVAT